jgi:ribosome-binding factor A
MIIRDFEAPMGTLVSVSYVTVSPDLKNATAYISIIPDNKLGSGLSAIKKFGRHVQKQIRKHLHMKIIPRIKWELDERDLRYKEIDDAIKNSD